MIDVFSKAKFESSLPNTDKFQWKYEGFIQNEHCYSINADPNGKSKVFIRSSIGVNGYAAETGEDSIRVFLVDKNGKSLGSKISKWTTRVNGWEDRLKKVIKELIVLRGKAGDDSAGNPLPIFKCRKEGPNKGRFFVNGNDFRWLD